MLDPQLRFTALVLGSALAVVALPPACGGTDTGTAKTSQSAGSGGAAANATNSPSSSITFMSGPMSGPSGTGGAGGMSATSGPSTTTSSTSSSGAGGFGMTSYLWDAAYGGTTQNDKVTVYALAIDGAGNEIVAGAFQGTINFDGGNTARTSNGGYDIFVAKYDTKGKLVWVKTVGGNRDDAAYGIAVDPNGRIAVCGMFQSDSINFGGNNLTALGFRFFDLAWAAVLDSNGNHLASQAFGDFQGDGYDGQAIAFDPSGKVLLVGRIQGPMTFTGPLTINPAGGKGNDNMYLAKLQVNAGNRNFDTGFLKVYGCPQGSCSWGWAVAAAQNGDIAIGGVTNGPIDFGNGAHNPPANPNMPDQATVARLDGNGNEKFSKLFPSAGTATLHGLAFHGDDLLVGGTFKGSIDLDGGKLGANGTGDNQFIARYDVNGKLLWGVHYGDGSGSGELFGLAADPNGYPLWGGQFTGQVTLNQKTVLKDAGNLFNGELVKLGPGDGHVYWAYGVADMQASSVQAVAVDGGGNSVFVGNFRGSINLGGGLRTAPNDSQWFYLAGFGP